MALQRTRAARVSAFDLPAGRRIGPQYEVVRPLGGGREGEVYQIQDRDTGIYRAAKLFYPHRDPKNRAAVWYARKLDKLRHCPIVLQYHHRQLVRVAGHNILCLISEFCEGAPLGSWANMHPGRRLHPYVALHAFHTLVAGIELIHAAGEYHADIHSQNILIAPQGMRFDLRLVDFYNWGQPTRQKQQQDILDAIFLLYEILGGRRYYANLPQQIRWICCGLKHGLILRRFPTIRELRLHLETFSWARPTKQLSRAPNHSVN